MALYAIGDPHLSFSSDKPMDVFGAVWENHADKLAQGFSKLGPDDLCVICGDLTWAMTLEESLNDFKFIDSLPGQKIILKGNHDYWWTTVSKLYAFFEKHGITTIQMLNNNCYFYGNTALCGTRGWFCEEGTSAKTSVAADKKILLREAGRLELSLREAGDAAEKICFFHYPPIYKDYVSEEIIVLMKKYGVKTCYYGHIHGIGRRWAKEGEIDGITYRMVSADHLNFTPIKILD